MLTIDDMRTLTHGGTVEEEPDGSFGFARMTQAQYAYFTQEEDVRFRHRLLCAAGICLDFYTNATLFSFDYALFGMADRDIAQIDVMVDGVLVDGVIQQPCLKESDTLAIPLQERGDTFRRVTVWLPYLSRIRLSNVHLSPGAQFFSIAEGAPGFPGRQRKRLLCYGDSITQGYDALHPSQTYAVRLSRYFDWELWNNALSGYVFDAGLLDAALPFTPDIVTIAYGTNDWNKCTTVEEAVQNATAYFAKVKALHPDSQMVYFSPLWRADIHTAQGAGPFGSFCDALLQAARDCGIVALDGRQAVPHKPEAFADNNLHPNDWGMSCYCEYLVRFFLSHHRYS